MNIGMRSSASSTLAGRMCNMGKCSNLSVMYTSVAGSSLLLNTIDIWEARADPEGGGREGWRGEGGRERGREGGREGEGGREREGGREGGKNSEEGRREGNQTSSA